MSVRIRNTRGPQPPVAPTRPDGRPYRFEMIFQQGAWRTYADEPAELVGELIAGYDAVTSPMDRATARRVHAVQVQVWVQARLAVEYDLAACTEEERQVLLSPRDVPPAPVAWRAPVPLVLVRGFYRPEGPAPVPVEEPPGEIWWIDPVDDITLLTSLHQLGEINLAVADHLTGPGGTAGLDQS